MTASRYPEHEKLEKVQEHTQVMGEWVEWLQAKGYVLAEYDANDRLYAVHGDPSDLLAEFFGIDQRVLEQEKRAMLDEMRETLGQ